MKILQKSTSKKIQMMIYLVKKHKLKSKYLQQSIKTYSSCFLLNLLFVKLFTLAMTLLDQVDYLNF